MTEPSKYPVRLNKFLAERLGIPRRGADELIKAKEILLNGQVAEIGARVDKKDKVCYNNKEVPHDVEYVYYAFHKPYGYICSHSKQSKVPTIYELLPTNMKNLKNVGRLDRTSSGVILLTNDGDFAFELTHPKFVKKKIYEVTIHKPLTEADRRKITEEGVKIADGVSKFDIEDNPHPTEDDTPLRQRKLQRAAQNQNMRKARIAAAEAADHPDDPKLAKAAAEAKERFESAEPDHLHLLVTLTEGRNRQIRRTFAALGYDVLTLHRLKFGDYELGGLKPGEYRKIEK